MISLALELNSSTFSPRRIIKGLWCHKYSDLRFIFEQSDELHYFYIRANTQRLAARIIICSLIAILLTITALSLHSSFSIWRYGQLEASKIDAEQKKKEAFEALADLSDESVGTIENMPQDKLLQIAQKSRDKVNKMQTLVQFASIQLAHANETLELGLKVAGISKSDIEKLEKSISLNRLGRGGSSKEIVLDPSTKDYKKNLIKNEAINQLISSFPKMTPVNNPVLTSKFGPRIHPITGRVTLHEGLDYAPSADLYAKNVLSGVVYNVANDPKGYGNVVTISHGNGIKTLYGHLSAVFVTEGQKLEKGNVVGKIGNTGLSTGTHLHFEVSQNNVKINPQIIMAMANNVQ